MRISACWIVKNEEANIARSIESLCEIADELIVVDTGSTDKTMEIAGRFGAKVYDFEWTRDFSKARNYAISKASGDIIFFLDADEWFSPKLVLENKKLIVRVFENNNSRDGVSFVMRHLDMATGETATQSVVVRAFWNRPYLRYTQKIHEQITNIDSKKLITAAHFDGWKLLHSGYSPDAVKKKASRNIEMLRESLNDGIVTPL